MKFLILTCSTGGGHHTAAAAISEYFTVQGHTCVTMDCLDFLSPAKAKIISEGHVFLYRNAPKLFGAGYRFEEKHAPKFIMKQCEACADDFYQAVQETQCDAVIHVHIFCAMIMTAAKQRYRLTQPGFYVATDYGPHPGTELTDMDAYFIPHRDLLPEFVRTGIPAEKLVPAGIPVRQVFCCTADKQAARQQLGFSVSGKLALLTCGSMGAGPMAELAARLDRDLPADASLVVVCGTNEKLKQTLDSAGFSDRIHIRGFVSNMAPYLDSADLILTKAGGLATTEALMKRLPLVYINAVPGCETRNLEFMVRNRYAVTASSTEELARLVCSLLQDDQALTEWSTRLADGFPDIAVEHMYRCIMQKHLHML